MNWTAERCLGAAIRVEALAEELYAGLAATFEGQPWLRDLFLRLAAEEGQHAMRIRLLRIHAGRTPWPAATLQAVGEDLEALAGGIAALRAEFRSLSGSGDAREVLRKVAELEVRFATVHAEELARSADPEVQRLFGSLALQDARHRELVEDALGREPSPAHSISNAR